MGSKMKVVSGLLVALVVVPGAWAQETATVRVNCERWPNGVALFSSPDFRSTVIATVPCEQQLIVLDWAAGNGNWAKVRGENSVEGHVFSAYIEPSKSGWPSEVVLWAASVEATLGSTPDAAVRPEGCLFAEELGAAVEKFRDSQLAFGQETAWSLPGFSDSALFRLARYGSVCSLVAVSLGPSGLPILDGKWRDENHKFRTIYYATEIAEGAYWAIHVRSSRYYMELVDKYNGLVDKYNGLLDGHKKLLELAEGMYNDLYNQPAYRPPTRWQRFGEALRVFGEGLQNVGPKLECTSTRIGDTTYTKCY